MTDTHNTTTALATREPRPSPVATVADLQAVGESIAKSGMFGACTPGKGLVIWSICEQEGISLLEFLRTYHVTNDGRVSMRADRMAAEFMSRGGKLVWTEISTERAAAKFSYGDNKDLEVEFTIAEAKRMGLIRAKSAWETDPGAMLRARVITRGVRIVCPGVCAGVYTPEELEDAGHTAPDTPPTPPRPLRKSPKVQAAVAAVADALDGEIVDDGPAPASPMDTPPSQAKSARKKPAKATAPAAPAGPVNPHVCPIPGKKHGLDWGEMSRAELEYARNVDHPAMTDAHRARIDELLAPAAPDELPF